MSKKQENRISKLALLRHLPLLLPIITILVLNQTNNCQVQLSDQDVNETVKFYKSIDWQSEVKIFQAKMPKAMMDEKIRKGILDNLPSTILKLKIENAGIKEKLKHLLDPVLKFYGRADVYDIIIFKHPTPIMFSDTGVVLVVSTGMITRLESDDELLGYAAHEIGHEYYAQYSIYSRYAIKLVSENGQEWALNRKLSEAMGLIELQCDAFAGLTSNAVQYNALEFIKGLERIGKDFPMHGYGFHPPDAQRRTVIEQIVPKTNISIKPKLSNELKELKMLVANLEK